MTADAAPGLVAHDVAHAFGAERVLDGVSLTLAHGEVGCLIGPSGCGKSTFLAAVGGLMALTRGRIEHDFRRSAFVFLDPCLLPWRNARDNIALGLKALPLGRRESRARADRLLAAVGLTDADADKYPHELSGGMRQRAALARALAVDPDLLLLDEPFSALDVGLRRQMQRLVRRLIAERGLTALLVTHDLAEAVRLADRIFVMGGRPARVVVEHEVARAFSERADAFVHAEVSRLCADHRIAQALAIDAVG